MTQSTKPIPFYDFGGQGPVLHFAHANGYPPACYRQFAAPLLAKFQLIGIKQRALWPNSHVKQAKGWNQAADDLIAFLDQQGVSGVVGMGHSLGAVATMYAAIKRPDLFSKLVLIEPVFLSPSFLSIAHLMPIQLRRQLNPMVKGALRRRDTWPDKQTMFDLYRQKSVFVNMSDAALWDFVNHGTTPDATGKLRLAYGKEWEAYFYSTPPKVWRQLKQVTQPVLGIRGESSTTLSTESWRRWQQIQPQATLVEIPVSGHLVPFEQPEQVAAEILAYLA